jgi:transcriptional regulator with XRE-family HTH domain/anti-sigma regulatory factor (Ser/Thr protein kinase)
MTAEIISLGSRLRQRREQLGLSQAQAARELDVARTAYRLWEMEAARPAPDRWRGIARWLGISMSAMLLAGELLTQAEAANANDIAREAGLSPVSWDEHSADSHGDYFSQERSMIDEQVRVGSISARQGTNLRDVLDRLQEVTASETAHGWYPGHFRKRFPCNELAPGLARAAIATTAVGIPVDTFHDALLLGSELVSNSVKHSDSDWVELGITVENDRVCIDVSDQSSQSIRPRTPDVHGGWGLALTGELATRWGVERGPGGKTIWTEIDLTP